MLKMLSLFMLILTACSQNKPPFKTKHSILHLNFASEPATFDPRRANYTNNANLFSLLYDGLYRIGPDGKALPSLAKEVEISPDGLKYVFHLKKSYWSNGDPVTAHDFEYAWKWMLTPTNPAPLSNYLYSLKNSRAVHDEGMNSEWVGVFAKDSDTLVVELEEPCPYFLQQLTQPSFYPVHQTDPNVTNGPFVVENDQHGRHLSLTKNVTYWDADHVKMDQVEISFVGDPNTELYLFEKGELDFAGPPLSVGMPLDVIHHLPDLHKVPITAIYFYSLNHQHPLLQNKKIRQALNLSLNREEIVTHLTHGDEKATAYFLLQENQPKIPTDFELKTLFQAGWEEAGRPPLKLTISFNKGELHSSIAQVVHHRFTTLFGIEVTLAAKEWKGYLHDLANGSFDCTRCSWRAIESDPAALLEIFEDPKHRLQHSDWYNPLFRETLIAGRKMSDPKERAKALQKAVDIFNEETPVIPLFYTTICYLKSPKLQGEVINQTGMIDFKWSYFAEK